MERNNNMIILLTKEEKKTARVDLILLMAEIPFPTTWDGAETFVNNGINYQPQLVSRISAINSN